MKHIHIIRSAYFSEYELDYNNRRLALTRAVCVPSLASQGGNTIELIIRVSKSDPLLQERMSSFWDGTGCYCNFCFDGDDMGEMIGDIAYGGTSDRVLITRQDDDDAISTAYATTLQGYAMSLDSSTVKHGPTVLTYPNGLILYNGRLRHFHRPHNMFIGVVSDISDPVTPFKVSHSLCDQIGPVHSVDLRAGWLWLRHGLAKSEASLRSRSGRGASPHLRAAFAPEIDWKYALQQTGG